METEFIENESHQDRPPQYQPYPITNIQNPPPIQTIENKSHVNPMPQYQPNTTIYIQNPPTVQSNPLGMNVICPSRPSQYKYPKAHKIFAGMIMGFGIGDIIDAIIILIIAIYKTIFDSVNGSVYAGIAISFVNGAMTLACGYLIYSAVKSRKVSKLKFPMILEFIAGVLVLIAFGLIVHVNVVLPPFTNGWVRFYCVMEAIICGLEGITYVVHLILCFIEINSSH